MIFSTTWRCRTTLASLVFLAVSGCDSSAPPPVTAANEPMSTPALGKPAITPTPDQLAVWKSPEYEPLVLLAAKESNKVGLVTCTAHSNEGKYYITAGYRLLLWSLDGAEPQHVLTTPSEGISDVVIRSMAVSPDGQRLAVGDSEGTVKLWSLHDRKEHATAKLDSNDIVDLAFSPDSQSLATLSYGDDVSIWSSDTLEPRGKFKAATNGVRRIIFGSNDAILVLGEKALVYKAPEGTLSQDVTGDRFNATVAPTLDRHSVVLGSDKGLQQWTAADSTMVPFLRGSFADTEIVAFAPDETLLATANGRAIRIWDIASQQCVQVIDIVGNEVVGLEWLAGSNLLLAIPDIGPIRIWGSKKAGEAVGLQPAHKPIVLPDASETDPAYPHQLAEVIDLRAFPQPPGSNLSTSTADGVSGEAAMNAEEAKMFYRYQLGLRGWMESTSPSANPMAVEFRKGGFILSTSFYESGDSKSNVTISHGGNFDCRRLPRLASDPADETYASEQTVIYRTPLDLLTAETDLLRMMHQGGWTAYSRLHSSHSDTSDSRDLTFLRNSIDLHVSIKKFPDTPGRFAVTYTPFVMVNSLPIPDDSGFVEFNGHPEPSLVASTSKNLDEAQAFYDDEMNERGWIPLTIGRTVKEEYRYLPFLQGQKDVVIVLQKMKIGRTLIRVGEELERSSWQLAKENEKEPKNEGDDASKKDAGLEAADFPTPSDAKDVKYQPREKSIEFKVEGASLAELAKRSSESLATLGWVAEQGGIRSEECTFFNFQKDKAEIAFRASTTQGVANVSIQGDGLLWSKKLPGKKQIISYELWLRDNKHPAGLDLLDRYIAEMQAIAG